MHVPVRVIHVTSSVITVSLLQYYLPEAPWGRKPSEPHDEKSFQTALICDWNSSFTSRNIRIKHARLGMFMACHMARMIPGRIVWKIVAKTGGQSLCRPTVRI